MDWPMVPAAVAGMAADRLALLPVAPAAGPAATATTGRVAAPGDTGSGAGNGTAGTGGGGGGGRYQTSDYGGNGAGGSEFDVSHGSGGGGGGGGGSNGTAAGNGGTGANYGGGGGGGGYPQSGTAGRGRHWRERCHCRHLYARDQLHDIGGVRNALEHLTVGGIDGFEAIEFGQSIPNDVGVPAEGRREIQRDGESPIEASCAALRSSRIPLQWEGSLGLWMDALIPFEAAAKLHVDALRFVEFASAALRTEQFRFELLSFRAVRRSLPQNR